MSKIELWCDGSGTASGPGGWAYVLRALDVSTGEVLRQSEASGALVEATNNRAELTALIEGLAALSRPSEVHVFTDSEHVAFGFTKGWLARWQANGWRTTSGRGPELVEPHLECPLCASIVKVEEGIDVCARHDRPVVMVPRTSRKSVRNRDLWTELAGALRFHRLLFTIVPGHSGFELNERCDELAGAARRSLLGREAA